MLFRSAMGEPRAITHLTVSLADEQRGIRDAAAEALGRIHPCWDQTEAAEAAISQLEASLKSREYWVRQAAAEIVARITKARSAQRSAPSPDLPDARAYAALAVMREMLNDADPDFRMAAAEALGRMKGDGAVEALERAMTDPDPWVASAAQESLRQISEGKAGQGAAF